MGPVLVPSHQRTTQVNSPPRREQLPLYQKPVSVFKIMEIAEHQIQMLISEGEYLKIAILDLNL